MITPQEHQVYLKQFEPEFGGSNYDHSGRQATGWRVERQQAEKTALAKNSKNVDAGDKKAPATATDWIGKLASMFAKPVFSD